MKNKYINNSFLKKIGLKYLEIKKNNKVNFFLIVKQGKILAYSSLVFFKLEDTNILI